MVAIRVTLALATLLSACLPATAQMPSAEQQVKTIIEQYNGFTAVKDVNGLMRLYHDQMDSPALDAASMRKGVEGSLKTQKTPSRLELLAVVPHGQTIGARVRFVESAGEPSKETSLFVLRPQNGRLKICGLYNEADPNAFDPATRLYTSHKGRLSVRIPEDWTPVKSPAGLGGLVPDSLSVLAPDLRSSVILGFVQLPMKLASDDLATAQKGLEADSAMEKRFTTGYQVMEQGPSQVAGRQAYRLVSQFSPSKTGEDSRKRLRVYVSEQPMLYFFVCDALPPEAFEALLPQFESIVSSLDLAPGQGNLTRQETVAAGQAKGTVTGRVYSSTEYNCFIAAPQGWEIRTSPNPMHLVEMTYAKGKSLARLIAAKGLKESDSLRDVVTTRLDSVKQIVQDFNEVSRKDVSVAATAGIESVQTFKVEGLGGFHIREVTLIRDGTYYLILCQCIEPDDFAALDKDFERIILSFGFIQ